MASALPSVILSQFCPSDLLAFALAVQGVGAGVAGVGDGGGGGGGGGLAPWLILTLCLLAGVGTVLLLPGRRSVAWRRIGGAVVLAAGVFLAVALLARMGYQNVYFWAFSAIALFGSIRVITHPRPVYAALYFVLTVFASAGLFVLLWAEFIAVALVVIYAGAILVTYTFVIMLAAEAAGGGPTGEEAAKEFIAEHDREARSPWMASAVGFLTMGLLLFAIFERAPEVLEPRRSVIDSIYFEGPTPEGVSITASALGRNVVETHFPGALMPDEQGQPASAQPRDGQPATDATPGPGARGDLYPFEDQPSWTQLRGGIQVLGIYLFTRQMVALQIAGLLLTVAMIGAIVIARKQVLALDASGRLPPVPPREAGLLPDEAELFVMPHTPIDDNPKSLPVVGTGNPRQKAYPQN